MRKREFSTHECMREANDSDWRQRRGEKEEKLFAQLVYWQIQFPDQRWTVAGGRSMLSIL